MSKRLLISLGGNALGVDDAGLVQTAQVVAGPIAALIAKGHQVLLCHGNGPQVGLLKTSLDFSAVKNKQPLTPLHSCVAMSQSMMGVYIQNEMQNAMGRFGVLAPVVTVVTRCEVDADDPGFQNPTKPVGAFMSEGEAEVFIKQGKTIVEDSGRGYREVVASPVPFRVLEKDAIRSLMAQGCLVIAGGGGGVPVVNRNGAYQMVDAVIDKDFTSVLLANDAACDTLVLLTGVDRVAINFRKDNETWLSRMSVAEAEVYIAEGQFPKGSMLPKVQAAVQFVKGHPDKTALITSLEKLEEGIEGVTGTIIYQDSLKEMLL